MIIDRQARPWAVATAAALVVSAALYAWYHAKVGTAGVSGGTGPGLAFGIAGSAAMLVALLLGLRKRYRTARVGRVFVWMQAHVWLGLLSFPLILFHAGFKPHLWGGPLTQVTMWGFVAVFLSGVAGLILQQFIPTLILTRVPSETVYEQHRRVLRRLRIEAHRLVHSASSRVDERDTFQVLQQIAAADSTASVAMSPAVDEEAGRRLSRFYEAHVRPYMATRIRSNLALAKERSAGYVFEELQTMVPPAWRPLVDDLREIVEERRQMLRHRRLHQVLHGWLLVHVPLSYGVAVLAAAHAVSALRYR
jgi:hypothetical protein